MTRERCRERCVGPYRDGERREEKDRKEGKII